MFRSISIALSIVTLAIVCLILLRLQEVEDKVHSLYSSMGGMATLGNGVKQNVFHPIPVREGYESEDENGSNVSEDSLEGNHFEDVTNKDGEGTEVSGDESPPPE
jgi:hypothetical protein